MPTVHAQANIDVRSDPDAPFDVVVSDIVAVVVDSESMVGQRPLDSGPLRPGFRWEQTVIHNRKRCRSEWVVTDVGQGRVLESTMRHFCADAQRETRGGERWEFDRVDETLTVVRLHSWQHVPEPLTWLVRRFGGGWRHSRELLLCKRLLNVQHRVERAVPQS